MSAAAALSLRDVEFAYRRGTAPVVRGVSLDVPAGSITAVLGPNGGGKTTLLRIMLGLLAPGSGEVLVEGRPLASFTRRELGRRMGLVPQSENPSFALSVFEYVLLGRSPHLRMLEMPGAEDGEAAARALEQLDLTALSARGVTELSGGELQLVTLARALAQDTSILLLDEPTSHLDLGNKSRILRILRRLAARGVTVVFTTHDPDAAAAVAEHVVLIREGRALAAGRAGEILTAERLRETYGVPVRILGSAGRAVVVLEDPGD